MFRLDSAPKDSPKRGFFVGAFEKSTKSGNYLDVRISLDNSAYPKTPKNSL
jgi:hypothetical protein